ncbi:MAG: VPLPA-CTERM sorting domain-containing protein [Pseudomonadota bacterium]
MRTLISAAVAACTLYGAAGAVTIDFNSLSAGDIVSNQFAGVSISGTSNTTPAQGNAAMIFDSNNPTGDDGDLGSPFEDPFTPGADNFNAGNILIVSEDGDAGDPDDDGAGGAITFDFDEVVTFRELKVLDINAGEGVSLSFFDVSDALITTLSFDMLNLADNEFTTLDTLVGNVSRLVVTFSLSGAIDDLVYDTTPIPVPAALPLFLSGLAASGWLARRRKKER